MNSLDVAHQKSSYVRPDYLANPFLISCRTQAGQPPVAKEAAPAARRQRGAGAKQLRRASKSQIIGTVGIMLSCFGFIGLWIAQHFSNIAPPAIGATSSFNLPTTQASALAIPATPARILPPAQGFHAQGSPRAYGMSSQITSRLSSRSARKAHQPTLYLTKQQSR